MFNLKTGHELRCSLRTGIVSVLLVASSVLLIKYQMIKSYSVTRQKQEKNGTVTTTFGT